MSVEVASSCPFNWDETPFIGFVPSRYAVVWGSGPAWATCLAGRLVAGFVVFLAEVFFVELFLGATVAAPF